MGDWKTAWDHIHFQGFLGTPMTFQFIWQGCDSLLAAPLVLDLVRFTERAWRNGDTGVLTSSAASSRARWRSNKTTLAGSFRCSKPGPGLASEKSRRRQ